MDELSDIEREERELRERLAVLSRRKKAVTKAQNANRTRRRPVREDVLDLLSDAEVPLNSLSIAKVLDVVKGRKVPSTRFGTLSSDEFRSWNSSRRRTLYLCHLLNVEDGAPLKRYWARSDWPLARRVFGPRTGSVSFLDTALWIIDLARRADEAHDPDRLRYLAADQARDAGLKVRRGEFDLDAWHDALSTERERLAEADEAARVEGAERLADRLDGTELLYGARPTLEVIPGTVAGWREGSP